MDIYTIWARNDEGATWPVDVWLVDDAETYSDCFSQDLHFIRRELGHNNVTVVRTSINENDISRAFEENYERNLV